MLLWGDGLTPLAPQIRLAGDFVTAPFRSVRVPPDRVMQRITHFRKQLRAEHRANFVSVVYETLRHATPLAAPDVERAIHECVDTGVSVDAPLLRSS